MKLLLSLLLPLTVLAQQPYSKEIQDWIAKNPPPNGRLLHDNVYMDETEVANIHWREYLFHLRRDSSERLYNKAYPFVSNLRWPQIPTDTGKIPELYTLNKYLMAHSRQYFPVIGITKEQADHFCRWRSDLVTYNANEKLKEAKKPFRVKYTFRLPTEKEWEDAAFGPLDSTKYPYGRFYSEVPREYKLYQRMKKGKKIPPETPMMPNFNCAFPERNTFWMKGQTMVYIYNYPETDLNLYNTIGNAAEMVQEEGIAKGGSWVHSQEQCKVKARQYYTCPTEWLGFRCLCTLDILPVEVDTLRKEHMAPLDWYKSNCDFVREREKMDTIDNVLKIALTFDVDDNEAFDLMIDSKTIFFYSQIREEVDFDSPSYALHGFDLNVRTTRILYDSLSMHLVKHEGIDVYWEHLPVKGNKCTLREKKEHYFNFDAIVAILYQKTSDPKRYKKYTIVRRI